jgi:hypothetical protein
MQYDTVWQNDAGYVYYDFNKPEALDPDLKGKFDLIVIDPPFIAHDVWRQYAKTVRFLLKDDPKNPTTTENSNGIIRRKGLVLGTTVSENKDLMMELFCASVSFFAAIQIARIYSRMIYPIMHSFKNVRCKANDVPPSMSEFSLSIFCLCKLHGRVYNTPGIKPRGGYWELAKAVISYNGFFVTVRRIEYAMLKQDSVHSEFTKIHHS